jgi:hypothetical protein
MRRALLALAILLGPALCADHISVLTGIQMGGFNVFSTGSVTYECSFCLYASITGTHQINDGGVGVVASRSFGPSSGMMRVTSYNDSISAATVYEHCYQAYLSATGSYGASNASGSGTMCAPKKPSTSVGGPYYGDSGSDPDDGKESPIVIDVDGGGYRFTSKADGVLFDIRNDGTPARMAWTRPNTEQAFLAVDRDGSGAIDNGAELFGNHTPLESGQLAKNGFEALSELDMSGDGVVDASDPAWSRLILWTDRDHDGRSSATELQPVATSSIIALRTDHHWLGRRDRHGNEIRFMSTVTFRHRSGDRTRQYYDVFLACD